MAAARASTDKAVMILSRYSTEGGDRKAEKGDWYLSDAEAEMLTKLSSLYDSVIVLINAGGAIDTSWAVGKVEGIDAEAVLYVWYPGAEGGNAMVDLLLGKVNPSGKLTMTLAETLANYPSDDGFDNRDYTDYTEDIYVGYRYFITFDKNVNYPFGFGLSYTTFSFTDAAYTADETTVTVRVTVTNTGEMAGKEVVQVYYGAPRIADGSKLGNPKAELAGFAQNQAPCRRRKRNRVDLVPDSFHGLVRRYRCHRRGEQKRVCVGKGRLQAVCRQQCNQRALESVRHVYRRRNDQDTAATRLLCADGFGKTPA